MKLALWGSGARHVRSVKGGWGQVAGSGGKWTRRVVGRRGGGSWGGDTALFTRGAVGRGDANQTVGLRGRGRGGGGGGVCGERDYGGGGNGKCGGGARTGELSWLKERGTPSGCAGGRGVYGDSSARAKWGSGGGCWFGGGSEAEWGVQLGLRGAGQAARPRRGGCWGG